MSKKYFAKRGAAAKAEWRSEASPRSIRRLFWFEVALLTVSTLAATAVYLGRVMPLSASPEPPPDGVAIAWAGQQLQGYAQTIYVSAPACDEPVKVVLDLYEAPGAPESLLPQDLSEGPIALTFTGDAEISPADVKIWTSSYERLVGNRLLYGPRRLLPSPRRFASRIQPEGSTGEPRSVTFTFNWNPVTQPSLDVEFEAEWLSPRVEGHSCWLTLPAQLGDGLDAVVTANSALGHYDWTHSNLGQPLFSGGAFVNKDVEGTVEVDPGGSIPAPAHIEPASWNCGGNYFRANSCQASVVLRERGEESSRSSQLVLWSTLGGLLLSICAASWIAVLRSLTRRKWRR